MVEFKLTIADPKTGKCHQRTVGEPNAKNLIGMKIGDVLKGEAIDLAGYEFVVTGGSDYCGFPMRKGISGARKRILVVKGVGFRGGRKGEKRRKTVCGEKINEKISQVNLKITKEGKTKLAAEAEKPAEGKEAPKKEEKPAEKKAESVEKKEEAKKEKPEATPAASGTQTKQSESDSSHKEEKVAGKEKKVEEKKESKK